MTDTTALDELIKAVEAGTMLLAEKAMIILLIDDTRLNQKHVMQAFHGSLDAAKALHDALLPGWAWYRWPQGDFEVRNEIGQFEIGQSFDPARAWLLAILRAYRAQIGGAA